MAVSAAQVTVSTTPVRLDAGGSDSTSGHKIVIRNNNATAADTLALGPSNVAAGTGFLLPGGATVTLEFNQDDTIYGIRGTAADVSVSVLRLG